MSKRLRSCGSPAIALALAAAAPLLLACAPTLDWRDVRPAGSGARLLFPCRPEVQERNVGLAETRVSMHMHSCTAGGSLFTLAFADAPTPATVTPLLAALRKSSTDNIDGAAAVEATAAIAGATANAQSAGLRIEGRLPDGRPVVEHAVFFVRGLKLYRASVIGGPGHRSGDAHETFFESIRLL